jgi:hypothetical protein
MCGLLSCLLFGFYGRDGIRARRAWLEGAIAAALNASERELLFAATDPMLKLAFHQIANGEE